MIEIENRTVERGAVIAVRGQVDMSTSPALRRALRECVAAQAALLVVNLTAVGYMDSSGVATMVEGLKASQSGGKSFVLLKPSESVMKVLQLARLDSVFTIKDAL